MQRHVFNAFEEWCFEGFEVRIDLKVLAEKSQPRWNWGSFACFPAPVRSGSAAPQPPFPLGGVGPANPFFKPAGWALLSGPGHDAADWRKLWAVTCPGRDHRKHRVLVCKRQRTGCARDFPPNHLVTELESGPIFPAVPPLSCEWALGPTASPLLFLFAAGLTHPGVLLAATLLGLAGSFLVYHATHAAPPSTAPSPPPRCVEEVAN